MTSEQILILEDERAVAKGLEYGLKSEGFRVLWAKTGQEALDLTRQQSPDLLLLDIRLPDMSGFDVCRILRGEGRREPIIMLTARDEEVDKILGLELGADDYVVKPYSLREVISRVRAMLRRAYGELSPASGEKLIRFGDVEVDTESLRVKKAGQEVDLTPTEFRLLRYLVTNSDRPFDRDHLIEKIWGYNSEIYNDRTVDVHIRHLRQKLEDDPAQPRWFITVRSIGYKFARNA